MWLRRQVARLLTPAGDLGHRYWTNRWMSAPAMVSLKVRYSEMVTSSKAKSVLATLKCRIEGPQAYHDRMVRRELAPKSGRLGALGAVTSWRRAPAGGP